MSTKDPSFEQNENPVSLEEHFILAVNFLKSLGLELSDKLNQGSYRELEKMYSANRYRIDAAFEVNIATINPMGQSSELLSQRFIDNVLNGGFIFDVQIKRRLQALMALRKYLEILDRHQLSIPEHIYSPATDELHAELKTYDLYSDIQAAFRSEGNTLNLTFVDFLDLFNNSSVIDNFYTIIENLRAGVLICPISILSEDFGSKEEAQTQYNKAAQLSKRIDVTNALNNQEAINSGVLESIYVPPLKSLTQQPLSELLFTGGSAERVSPEIFNSAIRRLFTDVLQKFHIDLDYAHGNLPSSIFLHRVDDTLDPDHAYFQLANLGSATPLRPSRIIVNNPQELANHLNEYLLLLTKDLTDLIAVFNYITKRQNSLISLSDRRNANNIVKEYAENLQVQMNELQIRIDQITERLGNANTDHLNRQIRLVSYAIADLKTLFIK